MDRSLAKQFIAQYAAGKSSAEEQAQFRAWLMELPDQDVAALLEEYQQLTAFMPAQTPVDPAWTTRLIDRVNREDRARLVPMHSWKRWLPYAAAVVLIAGIGGWLLGGNNLRDHKTSVKLTGANDLPPGGNKAVLTLADGSQITLDSAGNGNLARQGNTTIIKLNNGQLAYNTGAAQQGDVTYNTLRTPRGGQYQIVLPDGTTVWLNAASSLRFPTVFTGKKREVELKGEGYFDVKADASKPFVVNAGEVNIAVLGTVFNVMAYGDEAALNTTLVSGGVKVSAGKMENLLHPGQQSRFEKGSNRLVTMEADVEQATAWVNGQISLDNADIQSVVRQIARWYDVDIEIEGPLPVKRLGGILDRKVNLSSVLAALEAWGIKSRKEGNKLIIFS